MNKLTTTDELTLLKLRKEGKSYKELAEIFKVDIKTVGNYLRKNNATFKKEISNSIKNNIIKEYTVDRLSNLTLSRKYNVHRVTIQRILLDGGVELRKSEETSRKYTILNFKGDIITNNDAYILGLIWSDGSLSRNCIEVSLQETDKQILSDISKYVYGDEILSYRNPSTNKFDDKTYNIKGQFRFIISSKEVSNKLRTIGLHENKSLTCRFPTLKSEHIPHFIRGLIDGDGTIYTKRRRNCRVTIVSNHKMCDDIMKVVNSELGINSKVYNKTKNVSSFTISGRLQILKFLDWIYDDSELKLNRKYNKYLELK